jgi:single-strand DNA-binding protein
MNCITLVGRAGRDPEVRYFESGSVVANLTLAVKGRGRDAETVWFPLQIWGKQAQVVADYVRKGSLIGVTGSVKMEKWTDRASGEERSKMVVMVDRLDLLGSKRDEEGGAAAAPAPAAVDPLDDEVPF